MSETPVNYNVIPDYYCINQSTQIGEVVWNLPYNTATAIVYLYRAGKKIYVDKSEAERIARELAMKAVAAIEVNTKSTELQIKLLESMHKDINLCRRLNMMKMEKAQQEDKLKNIRHCL